LCTQHTTRTALNRGLNMLGCITLIGFACYIEVIIFCQVGIQAEVGEKLGARFTEQLTICGFE
jgi:hypothetical protein